MIKHTRSTIQRTTQEWLCVFKKLRIKSVVLSFLLLQVVASGVAGNLTCREHVSSTGSSFVSLLLKEPEETNIVVSRVIRGRMKQKKRGLWLTKSSRPGIRVSSPGGVGRARNLYSQFTSDSLILRGRRLFSVLRFWSVVTHFDFVCWSIKLLLVQY